MNVAAGDGNHAGGHARAGLLNRAGVRAAEGKHLALIADVIFFRTGDHQLHDRRGADEAAVHDLDRRALAQLHRQVILVARHIAHAGHIQRNAQVRINRVRRSRSAAQADLLLHGEDGDHVVLHILRQLEHGLRLNVAGDAVVHRRGGQAVFMKLRDARSGHRHFADGRDGERFLAALCAHVDIQVAHFQRALDALVRADHAYRAVFKHDVLGNHVRRADAADVAHADIAVLVRIHDHEADVVHMGGEHDALARAVALLHRDEAAHRVGFHAVHVTLKRLFNHLAHAALAAGRTVGGEDGFKQIHIHKDSSYYSPFHRLRGPPPP